MNCGIKKENRTEGTRKTKNLASACRDTEKKTVSYTLHMRSVGMNILGHVSGIFFFYSDSIRRNPFKKQKDDKPNIH